MIEDNLKEIILAVNWLSHCGKVLPENYFTFRSEQIFDWSEVNQRCGDIEWENATLEQSNNLSSFVERTNPREYENWNKIAKNAKFFFDQELKEKLISKASIYSQGKELVDSIEWDLIGFILESSYKKLKPPIFYENLFSIYEAGHFPCGLTETWPSGSIIFI
jgi:hypothetical protein